MNNRCLKSFWNWIWSLAQSLITFSMVICDIYTKSQMLVVSGFLASLSLIITISLTIDFIAELRQNSVQSQEHTEEVKDD